jgi:hypothetical protein
LRDTSKNAEERGEDGSEETGFEEFRPKKSHSAKNTRLNFGIKTLCFTY